jgi:hypothetical protein
MGFSIGGKAVFLAFLPPPFRKLEADALPERTLLGSLGIWQPRPTSGLQIDLERPVAIIACGAARPC